MRCFQCGTELPSGAKYCSKCGEAQGFSQELIDRAKYGDQNAIAELYNRTYNNVYFTVKTLIKPEDTVLDIVQDSYVKGFQSLSQLQDPDKFRAWIKRIAHNRAIDHLRKTAPVLFSTMSTENDEIVELEDDKAENLPEIVMDQKETSRLIKEILDSLSEDQRLVVGMFYYEQMSIKEISQILGVNENTVKSRLAYGRKKIESQVRNLEKNGTKLYGLAPLPFLLLLFKNATAQAAQLPNPHILQAIQKECSSVSPAGATRANVSAVSDHPVRSAAKKIAGTAPKAIAPKIIAGIIAAAVIIGAAVGIAVLTQRKDPSQQAQQTTQGTTDQTQEMTLSAEEIYQPILDEYGLAMGKDSYDEEADFPNINQAMMNYHYQYGGYDGTDFTGFYYDLYDIDGNGTDELLIGYGSDADAKNIVALYTIQDNQPQKLIDEPTLGERSQLYLYPDGTMLLVGSGGAGLHSITTYQVQADGSLSEQSDTYEGDFDLDAVLAEKSGNQQRVENFDWKPIDPKWEIEKTGDPKEYIGQYINGQDWNAGVLTIEENDAESVTVRLETFKSRSDQELSLIFEGIGYATQDGLIVDISGKQIKLTQGAYGLMLDPVPSLRLEWNLDPHIYSEAYLSTGF